MRTNPVSGSSYYLNFEFLSNSAAVQTIAKFAAAIFLVLGAGYVVRSLLRKCSSDRAASYSPAGRAALQFAREELKKHPDLKPFIWTKCEESCKTSCRHKLCEPVNQEIPLLQALFHTCFFEEFEGAFKAASNSNKETVWQDKAVTSAADKCIKIAFAISNLTLDDLKDFYPKMQHLIPKHFANYEKELIFQENALTYPQSYAHYTFYTLLKMYRQVKNPGVWDDKGGNVRLIGKIPQNYSNLFYEKNSQQDLWRDLYNEYCDRITQIVSIENLNQSKGTSSLHFGQIAVIWAEKDTTIEFQPDRVLPLLYTQGPREGSNNKRSWTFFFPPEQTKAQDTTNTLILKVLY